MSCERYFDLISARLDGPLSEAEQIRLDDHLNTCPDCRVIARQLQQMHSGFEGIEVPAPAELSAGVMKAVRAQKAGRRRLVRQLSGLAACLVICAGLFGLTRQYAPAQVAQDAANSGEFIRYTSDEDGVVFDDQKAKTEASPSVVRAADDDKTAAKTETAAGSVLADSATADVCHHVTAHQRQIVLSGEVEPGAALIVSVEQLSDFAAGLGEIDLSGYDDDFFAENTLVAVIHRAPTAGYTYRMEGVTGQTVFLRVTPPQAGDTAITTTLILGQTAGIVLPANHALNVQYQ